MRLAALTCILVVPVACASDSKDSAEADAADGTAPECSTSCDPCPAGSHCLAVGSFGKPIVPACVKLCNATDECGADEICLIPGAVGNAYCVSGALPAQCGAYATGHCDFFGYSECRDANTLAVGIDKIGVLCGHKLVRCPKGCEGGPFDGGYAPAKCVP